MLTPMQVQYVVGLCCLRHHPNAVDVIVGDLVPDIAADKKRDVDVTVTVRDEDGGAGAFKAYEVKHEDQPLDVVVVEQLCMKLKDMPSVTARSIVSTSGYTSGAIKKATAHGVELYELKEWTRKLEEQFPDFIGTGTPEQFLAAVTSNLLHWDQWSLWLTVSGDVAEFKWTAATPVVDGKGRRHRHFPSMAELQNALLLESTGALWNTEPAKTLSETLPMEEVAGKDFKATASWSHTHTFDVRDLGAYLKVGNGVASIDSVTVTGQLQWRQRAMKPTFRILERVPSGEVFAAAVVADYEVEDGRMFALVFPPKSRELHVHQFRLEARHRNAIRKLRIPPIAARE